jgi:hypothetical protein
MLVPQNDSSRSSNQGFSRGTKIFVFALSLMVASSAAFFLGRKSFNSLGPWIDGCIELWSKTENTPGLEITSFSFQTTDEGILVCQGSLRNLSKQTITSPKLLILINDGQNKQTIQKKEHILKDITLAPGQSHVFSVTLQQSSCAFITAMIAPNT